MNLLKSKVLRVVEKRATHLEATARAELDSCLGRVLTDQEWAQMRANLISFVELVQSWHQQPRRRGEVGVDEEQEAA